MTREEAIVYLSPIAESATIVRYKEALQMAISALRAQQEAEKNEPCPLANVNAVMEKQPMTNGQRIRAMSDEELAKFINDIASYVATGKYCTGFLRVSGFPYACFDTKECCEKHVVDWLKQPVEEVESGPCSTNEYVPGHVVSSRPDQEGL